MTCSSGHALGKEAAAPLCAVTCIVSYSVQDSTMSILNPESWGGLQDLYHLALWLL